MFPRVMGQFLPERDKTGFEIAKDDCIKGAVVFFDGVGRFFAKCFTKSSQLWRFFRADLVNFIVFNRFAFLKQNRQVIRIVLQELLTKPDFVGEIVRAFQARLAESPRLVESNLGILLEKHPEYQPMDLLRIIAGPLVAYFMQRFVFFPDREFAEERDLKLIAKQILLILN